MMNIKTPTSILFFFSLSVSAITNPAYGLSKPENYVQLAFAAGSGKNCGLSVEESNKALSKIDFALKCEFKNGTLSESSLNSYLIGAERQFKKGRENPPTYPANVCKSILHLVRSLNKTNAC
jgi:hypothetical protein